MKELRGGRMTDEAGQAIAAWGDYYRSDCCYGPTGFNNPGGGNDEDRLSMTRQCRSVINQRVGETSRLEVNYCWRKKSDRRLGR